MKAIIDIDDVLADLILEWLKRYNRKSKDSLKKESILSWEIDKYVLPEYKTKIYEFIENPRIYNKVKPLPHALEGIQALRDLEFEIIYCTYSPMGCSGRKLVWLQDNNFWNEKDHYVETKSKYLIRADLLVDDNPKNIKEFGGMGLLFDQPWNGYYESRNRMMDWQDILNNIQKYKDSL